MISSLIHRYTLGQLMVDDIHKLKGYLAYAKHIEGEFISSMNNKYGVEVINSIFKYN